jgi:hypothetical protein
MYQCNSAKQHTIHASYKHVKALKNCLSKIKFPMDDFLSSEFFVQSTAQIRSTEKFGDAVITLDDGSSLKVHRFLLARDSIFFRKLFDYKSAETSFHLEGVSTESFTAFLDWVYEVHFKEVEDCKYNIMFC